MISKSIFRNVLNQCLVLGRRFTNACNLFLLSPNLKQYDLEGTKDINLNRKDKSYQNPRTWPTYQEDFNNFKHYLLTDNNPKVLLRVYDGEFYFLKMKKVGNVGRRHVSKELTDDFIKDFYENSLKCDKFSSHLTVLPTGSMHNLYTSVYGKKKIDYPGEFNLAVVLNKWMFTHFKNQIGIIGGEEKIRVIKNLMSHHKYRKYLGIDYFTDYISIPERFSCDDPTFLDKLVKRQLSNATGRVMLFGIGICKLVIASKFKEYHPATYIDVGSGISALAGFTSKHRPYSARWKNFRIKGYDYSRLDPMDSLKNDNIVYL